MTKEKGLQQAVGFVPQAVLWVMSQWWPRCRCQPPCPSLLRVQCEVPAPCASSQGHVAAQPLTLQSPEPRCASRHRDMLAPPSPGSCGRHP